MSDKYSVRNPLQRLRERATQLASPGVSRPFAAGAAHGTQSGAPLPTDGSTGQNAEGYSIWPAQYDIDDYDDPRAVYVEDIAET